MRRGLRTLGSQLIRDAALLMWLIASPCALATPDLNGIWQLNGRPPSFRLETEGGVPLRAEAARLFARHQAAQAANDVSWDSAARCIPLGVPRVFGAPAPFEILQEPTTITLLFQVQRLYRKIYLDPTAPVNSDATFMGQSMGHWEGNTLVIETSNFKEGTSLDDSGLPHSDALKLTEHLHLAGPDTLVDQIRIEDDKTFTRPWETTLVFNRLHDARIQEDICVDRIRG